MRVEGSVGLVTGGASGLGEATARMLVERGGCAVIADLPGSRGAELADELGQAAAFVALDVTVPEQVEEGVGRAAESFGRIDVCVNAAGVFASDGRLLGPDREVHSIEVVRRVLEVNLVGALDIARRAGAAMSAQPTAESGERGILINVSSIAGLEGGTGQVAYAASKGAIAAVTLPLARDLAPWGIRVVTLCPGFMETPMVAGAAPEGRERMVRQQAFPARLGQPEDFAGMVAAVMESPFLNGEVIRLDAAARLQARQ